MTTADRGFFSAKDGREHSATMTTTRRGFSLRDHSKRAGRQQWRPATLRNRVVLHGNGVKSELDKLVRAENDAIGL
jgi:hypothetical protein